MNIIAQLCESYLDEAMQDVQELIPTEQFPSVAKLIERDRMLVEALTFISKLPKSHDSIQKARDFIDYVLEAIGERV